MRAALYARISTPLKYERQNPVTQLLPLREFCQHRGWKVYAEYIDDISAVKHRPEYNTMLSEARKGRINVIVVVRLDRIFRSMEEFIRVVSELNHRNVRFVCTDQPIDTDRNDPAGQLLMHIIAAVAEFERTLISERVKAGIQRVRAQGKPWGGRRRKIIDVAEARRLKNDGWPLTKISAAIGVNRNLLSKALGGK